MKQASAVKVCCLRAFSLSRVVVLGSAPCNGKHYTSRVKPFLNKPLEASIVGLIAFSAMLGCGPASAGIVWSDEFNGDVIDSGTWTYDVGGGGFGNGQFEYDTARHENSYLTNGNLVIEARRENYFGNSLTSARVLTQGRFAFK